MCERRKVRMSECSFEVGNLGRGGISEAASLGEQSWRLSSGVLRLRPDSDRGSERPPYLGFVVQATGFSIGGSRMIRPTGVVVCGRADGPHRPIERFGFERLSDSIGPDSGRGATSERD